ncbi:hypothetical protein L1987_47295 [Smallanthus sonchifolius]|uniref:Uncharacterized protein n=1 Tax=Smallanthus sonchifolius TaxID=185202 RepID=A0ACB9G278_9ASTR|nr:hypothetical protein L1987_47295 [Smallanthus sonchifolius]
MHTSATWAMGIMWRLDGSVDVVCRWLLEAQSYYCLQPSTSLVADAHKAGLEVFASYFANDNLFAYNYKLLSKLGPKQNSRYTYHSARLLSLVLQLHHSNSGLIYAIFLILLLEDWPVMPMERIGFMLQRLHWKRASRTNRGLMLTSPLRPVHDDKTDGDFVKLLAIMASEKRLILQPHNWALRRDHGMMLYFTREYREVVQELSICMALTPKEEAEILEPFVEKLHLLRLESYWKSLGHKGLSAAINSDLMAEELKNRERTVELMRLERKKSVSSSDVHEIKDNEIENSFAAEIDGIRDQKPEIAMEQRKES